MQSIQTHPYFGRQPPTARIRRSSSNDQQIVHGGYLAHGTGNARLLHSGIHGMKWGIRRFQNEDGSYTEEGKIRYGRGGSESSKWKKSEAGQLSDDELRKRNSRLQAEQQYRNLMTSEDEKARRQFRKDLITKAMILPVLAVVGIAGRKYINKGVEFLGQHMAKKVKPIKAANMLKNMLKNANVPDQSGPQKEILGKHIGKIAKNLINHPGPKIYANGPFESPILQNRPYWRGL